MSKSSDRGRSGLLKQTLSFLLLVIFTFVNVNPSVALADSSEGLKAETIKAQDEYIRPTARDDLSPQDVSSLEPSSGPEQVPFLYQSFVSLQFRVSLLFCPFDHLMGLQIQLTAPALLHMRTIPSKFLRNDNEY